jgi:isochorismate synthase
VVRDTLREIRGSAVEKVVLARQVTARAERSIDAAAVLRRLREGYPQCTVFAFARGDACFLGATPERLVRLEGRAVRADPLAGSAARGATEDEDRRLGDALLADEKERREHGLVVGAVRDALEPVCSHLDVPETPELLRMPNVQHLHTPIRGVLAGEASILELVERLHPTPAAGGLPRDAALSLIRRYEPFDRGWYAGPVGWVDGGGNGEFAVAIRSALLRGHEALLYAGCGIVAGSDPEREYAESCLKLRPMLWALNGRPT